MLSLTYNIYVEFVPYSIIDSRRRDISFRIVSDTTVAATLPHFWNFAGMYKLLTNLNQYLFFYIEFDPHYSVLLDPEYNNDQYDECGNLIEHDSSDDKGVCILLFFFIYHQILSFINC